MSPSGAGLHLAGVTKRFEGSTAVEDLTLTVPFSGLDPMDSEHLEQNLIALLRRAGRGGVQHHPVLRALR